MFPMGTNIVDMTCVRREKFILVAANQVVEAFLDGKQNAERYIHTLGDYLFPFAPLYHGLEFQFQHDNAFIHTTRVDSWYLKDQGVDVMCWPAKS
ncbi:hypothetical protein PHMEG_00022145 [Phytophthora megakarya]|uniref:Transposase n=1 Tax=Phytophthora megakarya TaxID=4795 RepID=A0A225VMF7_9STRA|nr:hypothetical protein PHMEG_00022145 [Phytophthora megakarya]